MLGLEPGVAGWKAHAQMNPLSYGGMHPFVCFSKLRFAFLDSDLLVKTPLEGMNRKTSDAVNPGFVASSIRNKYVYHFWRVNSIFKL